MTVRPTTLASDELEVEVFPELGARIHQLRFRGRDILRWAADPAIHQSDPFFWGSYVMAPWCGRVEAGTATGIGERSVTLASNFPDGTAIHGQVYARPWEVIAANAPTSGGSGAGASFGIDAGGDAWPWPYRVEQAMAVRGATLAIELTITNRADEPMPAGVGIHPWFLRPLRLSVDGAGVFPSNTDPAPEPLAVAGRFDLRSMRDVTDDLDGCWTAIGPGQVHFEWPGLQTRAWMSAEAPTLYVAVASPSTLDAVAVEPQTHVPQGLRRVMKGESGALAMLAPGASLRLSVELGFEAADMIAGHG